MSKNAAIVLVSHAMPQVARVCNDICMMNHGKIVMQLKKYGLFQLKLLSLINVIFLGACCTGVELATINPPGETKSLTVTFEGDNKENPAAVAEVLSGDRETANAAWWGFNEDNATEALQKAIQSGAKILRVPDMGMPWKVDPIFLESNQEIIFEEGVVVIARKGSFLAGDDSLFTSSNKDNITLNGYGATFEMRKEDYEKPPYKKAEWRHTISLHGSRNIRIYGLTLRRSGGDGIYVGRGTGERTYCENIHIKDVIIDDNYRQGISVITVQNLLIENSQIINTSGTLPQSGIDFEPNSGSERLINCLVRNTEIRNNRGAGILINLNNLNSVSLPVSIYVESSTISNNLAALWVMGLRNKQQGEVHFNGNRICGIKYIQKTKDLNVIVDW